MRRTLSALGIPLLCAVAVAALLLLRPGKDADQSSALKGEPAPVASEQVVQAWHSGIGDGQPPSIGQVWQVSTDERQGGSSVARLGSTAPASGGPTLQVIGEVRADVAYPWSGAIWMLGSSAMQPVDARGHRDIVLRLRGDQRPLMLMLLSGEPGSLPQMQWIEAGAEWQTFRFALSDFGGADLARLRAVVVAASLPEGPFHFELEALSIE